MLSVLRPLPPVLLNRLLYLPSNPPFLLDIPSTPFQSSPRSSVHTLTYRLVLLIVRGSPSSARGTGCTAGRMVSRRRKVGKNQKFGAHDGGSCSKHMITSSSCPLLNVLLLSIGGFSQIQLQVFHSSTTKLRSFPNTLLPNPVGAARSRSESR